MLSIPVFASISGITIFRDDEDPSRFYYLPRSPRLAIADGGKPEFTFLRYQFPIERPGPEPGGGYMVFTTVMTEDPQLLENVKPALQARLRAENPAATSIPPVTLAPVDFTEGQVRLIIMQNNQFIKGVTLGKPSFFGDNSASVAVELSADAATLFYEALRGGGSVAAIEYDLTFPVRLPALTIVGHVDSQEVRTAMMGRDVSTSTSSDTWGNSESHEVAHRTSISETMNSMGMIHLEILKGSVALSQEDEDSLRAFAFQAMDDFIKNHFLKGGSVETDADRKSEWMSFLGDNIRERFDLNVSYRDVIKRDYNPSAQINPSFLGVPIASIVQDIDMSNAPWYFNNLEVTVDTNLDFTKYGDIIHSVVGNLSYDQSGPDGSRITHRDSVVFTADDNKPKTFKTRIIATKVDAGAHTSYRVQDTYHVDLEVNYKSGPTLQTVLQRLDTTARHLTLDIPNPGVMEITFATEPNAFSDQLTGVDVDIDYADPEHKVPGATETVLLNKDQPTAHYRRVIYAPWTQPYRYRLTYNLKDSDGNIQRSVTDWIEASSDTRNVNVPSPFDQAFSLNIVPSIDWDELREMAVDLAYDDDASDYHATKSVYFTKDTDKVLQWRFLLRNPKNRSFRYRETWLYTNNASEVKDWKTQDRDGTVQVGDAPYGVAKVDVDPSDIDLGGQVKRVLVHLTYSDPANATPDTAALLFATPDKQTWSVSLGPKQREYTYDATYFMKDNSRRQLIGQRGTIGSAHEFLILPAAPSA
jgi:hypothetical protein